MNPKSIQIASKSFLFRFWADCLRQTFPRGHMKPFRKNVKSAQISTSRKHMKSNPNYIQSMHSYLQYILKWSHSNPRQKPKILKNHQKSPKTNLRLSAHLFFIGASSSGENFRLRPRESSIWVEVFYLGGSLVEGAKSCIFCATAPGLRPSAIPCWNPRMDGFTDKRA